MVRGGRRLLGVCQFEVCLQPFVCSLHRHHKAQNRGRFLSTAPPGTLCLQVSHSEGGAGEGQEDSAGSGQRRTIMQRTKAALQLWKALRVGAAAVEARRPLGRVVCELCSSHGCRWLLSQSCLA